MQEFRRQMDRDNQHSLSDVDSSSSGDGIHTVGRSSHKMIEAVMQSTSKGKVTYLNFGFLCLLRSTFHYVRVFVLHTSMLFTMGMSSKG